MEMVQVTIFTRLSWHVGWYLFKCSSTDKDKPRYRTRKGPTSLNILGVCDCNMNFIYALTCWEGSAAEVRVLRYAINQEDGLKILRGYYYLCDNGYGNVEDI